MAHEHTLECLERGPQGIVCKLEPKRSARRSPRAPASPVESESREHLLRKIVPAGREGMVALVEHGKLVLYEIRILDYGCEQTIRRATRIPIYSAGLDPTIFPARAGWDSYHGPHGNFYFEAPSAGYAPRKVYVSMSDMEKPETTSKTLPDIRIDEKERLRRWWKTKEAIEARGNRVHTVWIARGRATSTLRTIFRKVAALALSGKSEDEVYDLIVAEHGDEAANGFFSLIRINWRNPMKPGDVFALETAAQKSSVPQDLFGDVPRIDWCRP